MISKAAAKRIRLACPIALLWLMACPLSSSAQSETEVAANPGRPTVSTPATLTPVGYLQFETGILGAQRSGEFANRTALQEVVKFTATKRVQLLVQSEPVVFADLGDHHSRDPGGAALGVQAVALPGNERRPTVAFSYFHSIYDGSAPDLDIGSNRNSGLLLVSFDLGKFHVDTNYIVNEQIDHAVHRAQFGQTLSVAHPIAGKLGFTGELWHFTQPFLKSNSAGLLLAPYLQPDAETGVRCGLQSRTDFNQHKMGDLCRVHISFTKDALVNRTQDAPQILLGWAAW